ncbi:hypothetical protein RN346_14385 [Halomonas sp. PAMB 3232]|uniref:hypothetical protein n=1 Tax=Halomonas sp. PAMB 3232 TaxID=3075221 RepID=UPI002896304F|nr:hypothetical protein [Halomonas sp. PAMB 3232]WNL38468.1 hypothetical protein RN346_14385 [Halomonas sp. PAMB 3232]
MRRSSSIKAAALVLATALLAGCATPQPANPRELRFNATPERTFREAVDLMVAQGYVIRHADLALGRAEASLARWPEYRLLLRVEPSGAPRGAAGQGTSDQTASSQAASSQVSVSALRGATPLAPYLLDPWLVELQQRLGEAP